MELSDQMALEPERVSVRHRMCCWTLLRGRLTRLMRFRVCVSQGSTFVLRTTLTVDRGAKAAAEAGNNEIGIMDVSGRMYLAVTGGLRRRSGILDGRRVFQRKENGENKREAMERNSVCVSGGIGIELARLWG